MANLIRGIDSRPGETYINLDTLHFAQYAPDLHKLTVGFVAAQPIAFEGSLADDLAWQLRAIFNADEPTEELTAASGLIL